MYKCILVVVDGSDMFCYVFDVVLVFVKVYGVELQLFYVVENVVIYYNVFGYDLFVLCDQFVVQGNMFVQDFVKWMQVVGVKGEMWLNEVMLFNDVLLLIFDGVKVFGVDLFVFGMYGCCGFCCFVFGSIVEQCVCYVMLFVLLILVVVNVDELVV